MLPSTQRTRSRCGLLALAFTAFARCGAGPAPTAANHVSDAPSPDILVTDDASPAGTLSVLPSPASFGLVPLGETATLSVRLRNDGLAEVVLSPPELTAALGAVSTHLSALDLVDPWVEPGTVAPGDEVFVTVRFSPVAREPRTGPIGAIRVPVEEQEPLVVPLDATVAFALAALDPAPIILPPSAPSETTVIKVTLENRGTIPLLVEGVALESFSAPELSLDGLALPPEGLTLAPGGREYIDLRVTMSEGDAGESLSGEIVVTSSSVDGVLRVPVQTWRAFSGHCEPVLVTTSLDFGLVPLGSKTTKTVVVRNGGDWPCSFAYVRISEQVDGAEPTATCPVSAATRDYLPAFEAVSLPPAVKDGLLPGATLELSIAFDPTNDLWLTPGGLDTRFVSAGLQVFFYDTSLPGRGGPSLVVTPPGLAGGTMACNLAARSEAPWIVAGEIPPTPVGCKTTTTITIDANPELVADLLPVCDIVLDGDCGESIEIVTTSGLSPCTGGGPSAPGPFTVAIAHAPTSSQNDLPSCRLKLLSTSSVLPESTVPLFIPATDRSEWFVDGRPWDAWIGIDPLPTAVEKSFVETELIALAKHVALANTGARVNVPLAGFVETLIGVEELLGLPDIVLASSDTAGDDVTDTLLSSFLLSLETRDPALLILRHGDDPLSEYELEKLSKRPIFVASGGLDGCMLAGEPVPAAPATAAAVTASRQLDLCTPGWGAQVAEALVEAVLVPTRSYELDVQNIINAGGYESDLVFEDGPCDGGWSVDPETSSLVFDSSGPCLPAPGESFEFRYTAICPE
jgi:hypothetical protein